LEHIFSVEMNSKKYVKSISISDDNRDRVLFEGNLGKLVEISIAEGDVLELIGVNGVLRLSLTKEQLRQALTTESTSAPKEGAIK
jgi:hypothetical protein